MLRSLLLLATLAIAAPAHAADEPDLCSPPELARQSAQVAEICAAGREWIADFKRADLDALMTLYTDDAQVALHGQKKLKGIAAVRGFFAGAFAKPARVEFDLHVEDIRIHGDVAHLISRYWYTSAPADGGPVYEDAGRSLLIYRRVKDASGRPRWKIMVDIDQATPDVAFPSPKAR